MFPKTVILCLLILFSAILAPAGAAIRFRRQNDVSSYQLAPPEVGDMDQPPHLQPRGTGTKILKGAAIGAGAAAAYTWWKKG